MTLHVYYLGHAMPFIAQRPATLADERRALN